MKTVISVVVATLSLVPLAGAAQPQCPPVVEVTVSENVLPAGEHVRVRARWETDWQGTISRVRLTTIEMSPGLRREIARDGGTSVVMPALSADLEREIIDAIREHVQCKPHPDGWTRARYPIVRQVKVTS